VEDNIIRNVSTYGKMIKIFVEMYRRQTSTYMLCQE